VVSRTLSPQLGVCVLFYLLSLLGVICEQSSVALTSQGWPTLMLVSRPGAVRERCLGGIWEGLLEEGA
jgi:hypothetical protein